MHKSLSLLCVSVLCFPVAAHATVRVVPNDQPTIQSAIDASMAGDTVLVEPGVYREHLQFRGRAVTLRSVAGPALTMIDGGGTDTVVSFVAAEGGDSVLEGFTITGGVHSVHAGGVHIDGASPTLRNNVIRGNIGGRQGHGISLLASEHALIEANEISGNRSWIAGNGAGGGGGIGVLGPGSVRIRNNQILGNWVGRYSSGGGVYLFDSGATQIVGNLIGGNGARLAGAGIAIHGLSDARVENNLIVNNHVIEPGFGGGVHWLIRPGSSGPALVGNTIAGNLASAGAGVYADGEDYRARIVNNLVLAPAGLSAIECGDYSDLLPPIVHHNNALGDAGGYAGLCATALVDRSNLSRPPQFVAGTWRPTRGSAGVDSGDSRELIEKLDLEGNPRACTLSAGARASVDIGALEYCGE